MSTVLQQREVEAPQRYYRKVIKIKAEDSPNVRYAMAQLRAGLEPTGETILPGVKGWFEYCKNRELWDKVKQCIALDAEFYEGAEVLMYPPDWLNLAETRAEQLRGALKRQIKWLGIDSAAGGDNTAWVGIDELGLVYLQSMKTPDTSVVPNITLGLMREHNIKPENVAFDAGGGGREHADNLRSQGFQVRTVAFGATVTPDLKHGLHTLAARREQIEDRYVSKNRRAEMYSMLREELRPLRQSDGTMYSGFAMPVELSCAPRSDGGPSLRRQLALIPLWYDKEGRHFLPSKQRNPDAGKGQEKKQTMIEICGCSPDECDALVLAVYVKAHKTYRSQAGVL